jgi:hypothetical protein
MRRGGGAGKARHLEKLEDASDDLRRQVLELGLKRSKGGRYGNSDKACHQDP